MKGLTFFVIVLLLAGLGGAGYFYLYQYKPMAANYSRMKAGMPELDKARAEVKKIRERESWIKPATDTLKAGLSDEMKAGKAEVVIADNGAVVINISEQVLYTPGSVTFAKESPQTLLKLATLLGGASLKDKDICIGNSTQPTAAQPGGKRKMPAKDPRELAAERSLALVKYLIKGKVAPESLVATAYSSKLPDRGFKIKENKTVIIIGPAPAAAPETSAPKSEAAPASQPKPAPTKKEPAPPAPPKPIPITPAPQKPN